MKWKWFGLLYVLQSVCSLELGASSFHEISNKNLNKGRHKTSRIASVPTESTVDPGILHDAVDSYFPDVVYPTTVVEGTQQFYYSPQGYDDVLGPFSNDVKSSYKNFAAGKGNNQPIEKSSPIFVNRKNTIKANEISVSINNSSNIINEDIIVHDNLTLYENDLRQWEQNTTQLVVNELSTETNQQYVNQIIHQGISDDAKGMNGDILVNKTNDLQVEHEITIPVVMLSESAFIAPKGNLLDNDSLDACTDDRYREHATNQCIKSNITKDQEVAEKLFIEDNNKMCHINIAPKFLVTSDTNNILDSKEHMSKLNSTTIHVDLISNYTDNLDTDNQEYTETDIRDNNAKYYLNVTSNGAVTPDTRYEDDAEMSETKYGNNTYFVNVNPNYVVTSNTGNTREDFVSDIMNIYSLIEETLRAVSVVEFVVSKTLGSLGLKENQNETTEYDQNMLLNNSMVTLVETF